ncbi:MAG: hypothetical protein IPK19_29475 [Chloroflexi bacterium]|nr:hypothetical protein [Chloroflexota bacterium]
MLGRIARLRIVGFVLLVLIVAGVGPAAAQDVAAWTIMFYSTADTSDIELPMVLDINEIEWVGSTADVNFVAQVDRTEDDPSWTDTRRFLLEKDQDPELVNSEVLESLGEVNMGDPASLVDFALWAAENFPAERYALVLSDHGGGWAGIGWDQTNDNDQITMLELDQALDEITGALGRPFDFIGFDACLMAQVDVLRVLAPYADYTVLSEETEPGYGWPYDLILPFLLDNPAMGPAELGQIVVDAYHYFYTDGPAAGVEDHYDLNLIDLSQVDALDAALTDFAEVAAANSADVLRAIGDARNNSLVFGGRTPDEQDAYSAVDLVHFLTLLIDLSQNSDVDAAAQALIDAAAGVVVHRQESEALSRGHGISVYFPRNPAVFEAYGANYPVEVIYMTTWQAFLGFFYGAAVEAVPPGSLSSDQVISIQGVFPGEVVSIHQPPVVVFDTDGQDILEVSFSAMLQLEDGTLITLDQSPLESAEETESGESIISFPDGLQTNQFTWGVEMPVVTDGEVFIPTVLLSDRSDPDAQIVSGQYFSSDGESVTAYLIFDIETRTVTNVWGVSESATAPFTIQPQPGDQFLPTWRFYDEEGNEELVLADSDPLTFGDEPFSYQYEPAASGTYLFVIRVEDIAGNVYLDSTTITVDNEALDIAYRGYTDIDLGMNFLYPWEWPAPVYIVSEDGSSQTIISNDEATINIYVNAYDAADSDEMLGTAYAYLDDIESVSYDEADEEPVTIWGYDGTIIPYSFDVDGDPRIGALLSIYVPDLETGFLVDLDVVEDLADEGIEVFNTMIGSINFFMPPEVNVQE